MAKAEPPKLILPTENDGLLTGNFGEFYQYVQRDFEGQVSQPWQGGQYGFVRDPRRVGSEVIYTRFHEGIDIRPLHREANPKTSFTQSQLGQSFTPIQSRGIQTTGAMW
jgi:hypothetical protein